MFDDICERYWEWRLKEFPTFATVQKNHNYDHVLEDFSLEAFDRRKVVFRVVFNISSSGSSRKGVGQEFFQTKLAVPRSSVMRVGGERVGGGGCSR